MKSKKKGLTEESKKNSENPFHGFTKGVLGNELEQKQMPWGEKKRLT